MESKRDIYNLWILYTTKNDEKFFRQFITGFVSIWNDQLHLDLGHESRVPAPKDISHDAGPHLKRLPDELISAIQKFLIIAKGTIIEQDDHLVEEQLHETDLLVQCLIIVARHFENISLLVCSNFISCCIEVSHHLANKCARNRSLVAAEVNLIRTCCHFLELLYDPYLTWRNFVATSDFYRPPGAELKTQLHAEIVPFIYDCFGDIVSDICVAPATSSTDDSEVTRFDHQWNIINTLGADILNILGAIIIGSPKNAPRVICPATIKIVMRLMSQWRCESVVRSRALSAFNVMLISLRKLSAVERQIEIKLVVDSYVAALNTLLDTSEDEEPIRGTEGTFGIDGNNQYRDVNALETMLRNVSSLLHEPSTSARLCRDLIDSNFVCSLVEIPSRVKGWSFNRFKIAGKVIESVALIMYNGQYTVPRKLLNKLLDGLRQLGPPTKDLLEQCFKLVVNPEDALVVDCSILVDMIGWLPNLTEQEQELLANRLLAVCSRNSNCIYSAIEAKVIEAVAQCLLLSHRLSTTCVLDLIQVINVLGKSSIRPNELRKVLKLLSPEVETPFRYELLDAISDIAAHSLGHTVILRDFWDIHRRHEGITVPEIEHWSSNCQSSGFVFHASVFVKEAAQNEEFDISEGDKKSSSAKYYFRRQLFHMLTARGASGFEVFISQDGSLTLAAITRKDYYAITCANARLFDGNWHTITVAVIPSKRPFAYFNVAIYKDGEQVLNAPLQISTTHERFVYCSMGSPIAIHSDPLSAAEPTGTQSNNPTGRGLFPSLWTIPNIVNQAQSYLTLPLKGFSGHDSSIKCIANGLQDNIYGSPSCLLGQLGGVLLAESGCNLKALFEMGHQFGSILSHESELMEPALKLVFCYAAAASFENVCLDLSAGKKYNGHIGTVNRHIVTMQDALQSVGGMAILLPLLDGAKVSDVGSNDFTLDSINELAAMSKNGDGKRGHLQNPVAYYLVLLKYSLNEKRPLQECATYVPLINVMLQQCDPKLLDVHVLMAIQILIEPLVQHSLVDNSNTSDINQFLDIVYEHLVFNFRIWSRAPFQFLIGHIQYLQTLIQSSRKLFRKKYGVQFILDVIRVYFVTPINVTESDVKAIRHALLEIVRIYIRKRMTIGDVGVFMSFIATAKNEAVLVELFNLLIQHMDANCKDQTFLLLLEPQTVELLYCLLIDKSFGRDLHDIVSKFMWRLIQTKWVSERHKLHLYLYSSSVQCKSLYPGLLTYLMPHQLSEEMILTQFDHMLATNALSGYCGAIALINHLQYHSLSIKLEICKRLLTSVFTNKLAPSKIAQQLGWQQAITKLFVKKSISKVEAGDDPTADGTLLNRTKDFMSFDQDDNESKVIAFDDVSLNAVEEYSVVKPSAVESRGGDSISLNSVSTISEMSNINSQTSMGSDSTLTLAVEDDESPKGVDHSHVTMLKDSATVSEEEQLVYLLTNIIFTILWRGTGVYENDSWKEEGQVVASINLLALTNELYCSHLTLRLRLMEMSVQACLIEMGDKDKDVVKLSHQQNVIQLMRMIYDLVVLDHSLEDSKKCSIKLLDGALAIFDTLMVFADETDDDWCEMKWVCLAVLIQCSHSSDPAIVAMATSKLLHVFQHRRRKDRDETAFLVFKLNSALDRSINDGKTKEFSILTTVMKTLLEQMGSVIELASSCPDLPSLASGPEFLQKFQAYSSSKQWHRFISKVVKPLYDSYQKKIEMSLWEPLNVFWAECYESCKKASQTNKEIEMESRQRFQEEVLLPWRHRQQEELMRQNDLLVMQKSEEGKLDRQHRTFKRICYGQPYGPWYKRDLRRSYWQLMINRENQSKMRLKLEPNLYHNPHTIAANLRDNTTVEERRLSAGFGTSLIPMANAADIIDEDDFVICDEDFRSSQGLNEPVLDKEKVVLSQECELIVLMSRIKGQMELTSSTFSFLEPSGKHDFRFNLAYLKEMHLRKYNLRRSALELFLVDNKSYFINLTTKTRNKVFAKIFSLQPPNIQDGTGRTPSELLKSLGLTQKWVNRELSNFDYLMHLNRIAGRSYNDLSQYPIFPWILADYTSEILDLTDPKTYRDLSKPIGALNPKNEAEVRNKYDNFEDPTGVIPKFHYGTHYSNSAGVLHYLLRVEPFTSLHVELQSGRFDVADRQFQSIAQTWKQLMDSPNDCKELIPEFFFCADFLKNVNELDLGVNTNTHERVNDVILPPWAHSAEDFIAIHRRVLESDYVSQNLHHWIDLIFGYKQKGKAAANALNVFYYCSYEGAVDLDKIESPVEREAVEGMINNFGQTPSQLMREAHPKRLGHDEHLVRLLRNELKRPDLMHFLDRVNATVCEMASDRDPVIYISQPRTPQRSFMQSGPDTFFTISRSGVIGTHSWLPYDKDKRGFLYESDNQKTVRQLMGPFHPSKKLNASLFALNLEAKLLYAGGIWDNSLKVFSIQKAKQVASVIYHKDLITCLAADSCGMYLVSGSRDCTCVIWSISNTNLTQNSLSILTPPSAEGSSAGSILNGALAPKPLRTLYGHEQAITSVAILTELDMVVSGSLDGQVNVYNVEEGQWIHTLGPVGCTGLNIEISFVTVNYQGHVAFSALDDTSYSVHVYTVNGVHLGSKYVSGRVTNLTTMGDHLVVADDAGDVTISRLHGLKPVFDIPLHIPIETLVVAPGGSHILAPMRDGSLAVVGVVLNTSNSGSASQHSIQTV